LTDSKINNFRFSAVDSLDAIVLLYSYANTSRIVSRAAFRAGKMLAIVDKANKSPSQMA
jgi:hypothetical protein